MTLRSSSTTPRISRRWLCAPSAGGSRLSTGLGLVIVDYSQLMRSHRNIENRVQEISEIARGLKSLARELRVPVIALSQLSRAVERREDKRPMLSDLRESGSIEAEADLVMMLYRPDYYMMKEVDDAESVRGKDGSGFDPNLAPRRANRDTHRQAPKRPHWNGEARFRERVRVVREFGGRIRRKLLTGKPHWRGLFESSGLGSGGREHAIVWKLAQSNICQQDIRAARKPRHGAVGGMCAGKRNGCRRRRGFRGEGTV